MPTDFLKCVRNKGRVITVKPRGSDDPVYIRICYDKKGKAHRGEIMYRKSGDKKRLVKKSKKRKKRKSKKKSKRKSKKKSKRKSKKKSKRKSKKKSKRKSKK